MADMDMLAIDIQNLPTLDEIEDLMIAKRQEMAELRKLKSLASVREKSRPHAVAASREGPDEDQPEEVATHAG